MEGVCPKSFEYLELISQSESSNQTFYSSISIDGNTKEINQAVHLRITGNKIPVYFSMSIKDRDSFLQCQTCLETLEFVYFLPHSFPFPGATHKKRISGAW